MGAGRTADLAHANMNSTTYLHCQEGRWPRSSQSGGQKTKNLRSAVVKQGQRGTLTVVKPSNDGDLSVERHEDRGCSVCLTGREH